MLIARIGLISLVLLLLARSCVNIALEPIERYDEALTVDLRTKACTITVTNPDQVSSIVNAANAGDVICLLPGVYYSSLYLIENTTPEGTTDYIVIRVDDTSILPPPGIRISNAYESLLPKIADRALVQENVHHRACLGIDFISEKDVGITLEVYAQSNRSFMPHHIIVDQCLFRSSIYLTASTLIVGNYVALLNSHFTASAVRSTLIIDGSVIKVQNNYYDVEGVFLQQTDAKSTDIEIRYNRCEKRGDALNYFGFTFSLFERVLIENNFIAPSNVEQNVTSDILMLQSYDGPSYQRDFIFRFNWVETFLRGFSFIPYTNWTGSVATEFSIYNNFLREGRVVILYTAGSAINFTQNTILNGRGLYFATVFVSDPSNISFNFERNIIESAIYGIVTNASIPIADYIGPQNFNWQDNLVITKISKSFPNNTLIENNITKVGFIDMDHDNYNLLLSSKYNAENYGVQLGVDICALINTAKLNLAVPGCILESVNVQPNEIIEITTNLTINGNLTMYPNSTLQVPFDDGKINVTNCANFAGILSLLNTTDVVNGTEVVLANYGCYNGGKFDQVSLVDDSDSCLLKYVKLTYAPTSLTATITSINTCNSPSATDKFPDWAIAVIIIGICVVLVAVFIVVAVTVPALHAKVFPFAKRNT